MKIQKMKLYTKPITGRSAGYDVFQNVACKITKQTSCIRYIEKDGLLITEKIGKFKNFKKNPCCFTNKINNRQTVIIYNNFKTVTRGLYGLRNLIFANQRTIRRKRHQ